MIEVIHAGNDVNLPGLATTEMLTRRLNLNYFSEAVSWEGEARLTDAVPGGSRAIRNPTEPVTSFRVRRELQGGLALGIFLSCRW